MSHVVRKPFFRILSIILVITTQLLFIQMPVPAMAAGATYYVATSGSDSNPGTQASPFRTIGKAAATAAAGDTVLIRQGTYNEGDLAPSRSGASGSPIVFKNYPGETPVINASGHTTAIHHSQSYIRWEGLEVTGANDRGIRVGSENYTSQSNGIEVVNMNIHDNGADGVLFYGVRGGLISGITSTTNGTSGIGIEGCYSTVVQNNKIDSPGIDGITCYRSDGITIDKNTIRNADLHPTEHPDHIQIGVNSSNITITNNFVYNDNAYLTSGTYLGNNMGIFVEDTATARVANNVIYKANGYSFHVSNSQNVTGENNTIVEGWWGNFYSLGNCSGLTLRNNIFYARDGSDNLNITSDEGRSGRTFDYNLFYRPSTSDMIKVDGSWYTFTGYQGLGYDTHGKFGNPSWVNVGARDMHLMSGSPAVNAGTSTGAPATDIDGVSRPAGGAYDIGAYEYGGTITPPPSPVLNSVTITPATVSLTTGGTKAFTAQALDQNGAALTGATYNWAATGGTMSATTGASSTYTAGTTAGTYQVTLTVTANGVTKTATAAVTVTAPAPTPVLTSVTLTPATATLAAGAVQAFTAKGLDQNGAAMSGVTYGWTATGGSLSAATGASSTYTAGSAAGSYTVTVNATAGGVTKTANAAISVTTVTPPGPAVTTLKVTPATASIKVAAQQAFSASAFDQNGAAMSGLTYAWTASGGSLSAASGANVTYTAPTKKGTYTVTVASGGKTASATVTVKAGSLHHVTVSPTSTSVAVKATKSFTAQGYDVYNNTIGSLTYTWTATGGTLSATTGASDVYTAGIATGTYAVKATTGGMTGSAAVTVTATAGDTTKPSISWANMVNGEYDSDLTCPQVNASDASGIAKVEFYVDDVLAATDTASPYAFNWYTQNWSNGAHLLKAKAYDKAGNTNSTTITVYTIN